MSFRQKKEEKTITKFLKLKYNEEVLEVYRNGLKLDRKASEDYSIKDNTLKVKNVYRDDKVFVILEKRI